MINIDEQDLKRGVMGLVLAIVEIIHEALKNQGVRRMEGGSLTEDEVERLGRALMEMETAIAEIKEEHGIGEAVQSVRDGLDDLVDDVISEIIDPRRWEQSYRRDEASRRDRMVKSSRLETLPAVEASAEVLGNLPSSKPLGMKSE